jgi:PAS domain S-box-containing protein
VKIKSPSSWKVQVAFGAAVAILMVLGAFSYRSVLIASDSDRWVLHTELVLRGLQELRVEMAAIQTSSRGFVLTGKETYFEAYRAATLRASWNLSTVRDLTADNLEQQLRLSALDDLIALRIRFAETVISLRRTGGLRTAADAISAGGGSGRSEQVEAVVLELQNEEQRLLEQRTADARQRMEQIRSVAMFGTALGVLITLVAGWTVQRDNFRRGLAEDALRDGEEQYRMLVYEAQDYAFFMLDPIGRIVTWNAGAERIKGYSAEDVVGRDYSCFFPPEEIERGRPQEILRMTAANGRHEEEGARVRKDGSRFSASLTFTALHDSLGKLRGFAAISRTSARARNQGQSIAGFWKRLQTPWWW